MHARTLTLLAAAALAGAASYTLAQDTKPAEAKPAEAKAAAPATATPPAGAAITRAFSEDSLTWGGCPPFIGEGCQIAVLHGDPSQPNADIFFKVPAGFSIPKHTHTSAERMVLVSGELAVTYDGQPEVVLRPGMYAYGPAKAPHSAVCRPGDPCVLFIAFEGPVDAMPAAD